MRPVPGDRADRGIERFAPRHEDVARALAAVRADAAERRAQAEVAARAEREEAARRLAEEQRQREEDSRRAEEEQRAARAAQAVALAETSRELASAGQYPQALTTLAEATRLDPANPALQELTRQIRDAKTAHEAAERRGRELAARLAEAGSRLTAGDLAKARKSTEAAAQIDAEAPGVQAMLARLSEAEARVAQEKAEQQRAAEAVRQARERDQKVGALITKARKARRPADALGFLEEAQRIDPQRPELAALIAQRQADVARAAAPQPELPADRVAEPGVPERKDRGRPLSPVMLGGAAAAVLLLVVGFWYVFRDSTPTPDPDPDRPVVVDQGRSDPDKLPAVAPSAVNIDTEPWTRVTLTPAAGGDPRTCTTPCQLLLPPGEYQLAFENGGLSPPYNERVSVPAGQPVDVRRTMPGFDVDRAVAAIVGR